MYKFIKFDVLMFSVTTFIVVSSPGHRVYYTAVCCSPSIILLVFKHGLESRATHPWLSLQAAITFLRVDEVF